MMRYSDLERLDQPALVEYVWKRLRLEGTIDPPLDDRFRMEPPEDFLIRALDHVGDEFRERLFDAIIENLRRLAVHVATAEFDATTSEQLASIGFLCSALADRRLANQLYLFSVSLLPLRGGTPDTVDPALFQLLRTVAQLQTARHLVPFWEQLWEELPVGYLRAIAIHGLARADPARALAHLDELISDVRIDLPVVAWSLATDCPGVIPLAKAAARLSDNQRDRLRAALETAGADEDFLQDFDLRADPSGGGTGFRFTVRPRDPDAAQRRPLLVAN